MDFAFGPEEPKAQGVGHHEDGAEAHSGGSQHGTQLESESGIEHTGGNGNAQDVIEESPKQVFMDISQRRPAEPDGCRRIQQAPMHQHHVRRLQGHIRPGPDGNAHVRPGQCRGVVYPVPHHGHLSKGLKLPDSVLLPLRQNARYDPVHPRLLSNGAGGSGVVSG